MLLEIDVVASKKADNLIFDQMRMNLHHQESRGRDVHFPFLLLLTFILNALYHLVFALILFCFVFAIETSKSYIFLI